MVLIDASSFVPDKKLVTVQLDTLWKVKAAQRKALPGVYPPNYYSD